MALVTGDQYLESLVKFVESHAGKLIEGTLILKLNPVGLRYVQSRLEALEELEGLLVGAPVDYLRAYVSDLGDHRALEQLRRILRLLPSLKMVSVLPPPARDPTPLFLFPFGRLKVLELRGCDLSSSAAKGLLELRFTLEKLICHNSTDALRHVFVSRIAEIKDSPQWKRLSFVSCACNGLVLMDESLQLLPFVETLDLSRNKFSKVDNLRKCTKLKHLDLGFNSLRSISSFREVSCKIVKLVLRNNALTTLRGIESMKSLEGLDLSYNIISNFSEIEMLTGLPSLQNLWLEGNPLCCARWYRVQVFSLFSHPEKLKLDDKIISQSEFWKQQIIVVSRQKHPASFGFYSPAKEDTDLGGSGNTKRRKSSRLVNIESEDQNSDQDSVSCECEIRNKEGNIIRDVEADIEDFLKRIERLKTERSAPWLQEFNEWMDQTPENVADHSKFRSNVLTNNKETHLRTKSRDEDPGETSRYISDSIQLSGDESSSIILESGTSFADTSTVLSAPRYLDRIGQAVSKVFIGHKGGDQSHLKKLSLNQEAPRDIINEWRVSADAAGSQYSPIAVSTEDTVNIKNVTYPLTVSNDINGSHSSLACLGSPPHYQDDILHRRHNLKEEFLQLSTQSLSVAYTDSNTSCSEDDSSEAGPHITQTDQSTTDNLSGKSQYSFSQGSYQECSGDASDTIPSLTQNGTHGKHTSHPSVEENVAGATEGSGLEISVDACSSSFTGVVPDYEFSGSLKEKIDSSEKEKKKHRRKVKKRMISLPEEDSHADTDSSKNSSDHMEMEHEVKKACGTNNLWNSNPAKENGGATEQLYSVQCT